MLPFQEGLDFAAELGIEYPWYLRRGDLKGDKPLMEMSPAEIDEMAERHDIDVAVSMMPWNYTNSTGNFRRVAEIVGSRRIKAMWGPADNTNCGELDVATAGFTNMRPYIYGVHLKDLRVKDGLKLKFDYCPIGEGDVDYLTVLRNLRDHKLDVYLSVSTHFTPPSGSRTEAMRTNVENIKELVRRVESEVSD